MRRRLAVLIWLPLLAGCVGTTGPVDQACQQLNGRRMLQAELFFGRDIAGQGRVSQAQWSAFLRETVTPRFPDGLTVLPASGQWRDRDTGRVSREPSFLVRLVFAETPETLARLAEVRAAYMQRFRQQSVGLVLSPVCASF
ncbi:MAG: DUF3574 domain-containing protein [Phreatobacter sp.]